MTTQRVTGGASTASFHTGSAAGGGGLAAIARRSVSSTSCAVSMSRASETCKRSSAVFAYYATESGQCIMVEDDKERQRLPVLQVAQE